MDRNVVTITDSNPDTLRGERRRSVRQKLHSPVYVSFNGPQPGMVVDLSELLDLHENGFAVQTAIPTGLQEKEHLEVNRAVTLCLELPETRKYLHGSGQVMWTDNTGRAGIRFSFLPEGSRQILKEWLFANLLVASTNHAARVEQVAHHQQEKVESPLPDVSTRDVRVQDSSPAKKPLPQDFSAADKSPALTPAAISVPASNLTSAFPPERAELLSALDDVRREVREIEARTSESANLGASVDLDPILQFITRCALSLTGATGAALALRNGDKTLCRARAGDPAPPVGSEVDVKAGLSGECVRHGIPVACEDPENDSRVDAEVCHRLGIGSFVAAPIFTDSRVAGLLEIFAPTPRHFARIHQTILQRLAELVPRVEENVIEENVIEKKTEAKETAAKTIEPQTVPLPTIAARTIETVESEQKKTALTDTEQNPSEEEIDSQKSSLHSSPPAPNAFEAPARKLKEMPRGARTIEPKAIAPAAKYESSELQKVAAASPHAAPRRPYIVQITLLLLVLGTVAMVLGYLLAPTIQKRWMGQPKLAQNSGQNSPQASSKSSLGSPYSLQKTTGQQGRVLSPDDLRKLAEQGNPDAQYQMGILYHDGSVVPKDDTQAVQWFQRAAEQGYIRAQSTLGAYYWAGRGVPQDLIKAYFWSQLALAQGDENSKSRLEGLSAQMTQSQVANARQQAEAWLHAHTQPAKPHPGVK